MSHMDCGALEVDKSIRLKPQDPSRKFYTQLMSLFEAQILYHIIKLFLR